MISPWSARRIAPDLAVFLLALAARLAYVIGLDPPLLYTHHLANALRIAAHPDPIGYIWSSDEWRSWGTDGSMGWTLAPLYYLFAAAVAFVFGPGLRALQILQCILESLTAVGVSRLGRLLAGPIGVWAGVAYAVNWHAVVFHSGADTENIHTVLLVWGIALLAGPLSGRLEAGAGALLLGLSALARAVSLAFLLPAALWQWATLRGSRGRRRGALVLCCGLLAVAPWMARNYWIKRELVPIETVSVFNLWNDNAFAEEGRWGRQARLINKQKSFAGMQAEAARFAARGWARDPGAGLQKIVDGLEYFLRPIETRNLLLAELPRPLWQHVLAIALGDVPFAIAVVLTSTYVAAGSRAPPRTLVLLWIAYYLVLLVVVFHTQVRYRTAFTPFLFACAAGGTAALAGAWGRRGRAALGFAAGMTLVLWASAAELRAAGRAISTLGPSRAARAAVDAGDLERAQALVGEAARRDPGSAMPYTRLASRLTRSGRAAEAIVAYQRALERNPTGWLPLVVLPRLLNDVGRAPEAKQALAEAHAFSRRSDPWLALEAAWRELPPPRTNEILVGGLDYGAVRGFMAPEQGYRWSRGRAALRLIPVDESPYYDVTVEIGSPEPSPNSRTEVELRVNQESWTRFVVEREATAFHVRARADPDGVLAIELRAPTWTRADVTPELGVTVRRVAVVPAP